MPFKRRVILGVVGDSAAGKTTLSEGVAHILGPERVTVICTDNYHRYNRKQRQELGISALDPACNYIDIIEQHLDLLHRGHPILMPIYNHSTGDFDPPRYIEPREFIIIEGLLGFYSRAMRRCYDVKVYLAPEEELRIRWKIKRDTTKRGYTPEGVRASLEKRVNASRDFIRPQQAPADIVVTFCRPPNQPEETGSHLNVQLILRPTLPHPDLSELIEGGSNETERVICSTISRQNDWLTETLEISGRISDETAARVEEVIWKRLLARYPNLDHLWPEEIGTFINGTLTRQSHPLALTQLLIAYHMILAGEELKEELKHKK